MWNDASTYDDAIDNIPSVGVSRRSGTQRCPRLGLRVRPIKRAYSRVSLTARTSGSKVTRSSSDDRPARAQRANGFELALFARIFA
jgi:hypothetical protein